MRILFSFAAVITCLALFVGCTQKPSMKKSRGTGLIYSLSDEVDSKIADFASSKMTSAILSRLDPDRRYGIEVAIVVNSKIQVSVPNDGLPLGRAKQLLKLNGNLEFLIAANARDHAELIKTARASKERVVTLQG